MSKDGTIPLVYFSDLVDIGLIEFYSVTRLPDGTVELKLYDKKKKLIKPYERNIIK